MAESIRLCMKYMRRNKDSNGYTPAQKSVPFIIRPSSDCSVLHFKRKLLAKVFSSTHQKNITDFQVVYQKDSDQLFFSNLFDAKRENENLYSILKDAPKTRNKQGEPEVTLFYTTIEANFTVQAFIDSSKSIEKKIHMNFDANLCQIQNQFFQIKEIAQYLTDRKLTLKFFVRDEQNAIHDLNTLMGDPEFNFKTFFSQPTARAFTFLYPISIKITYQKLTISLECNDQKEKVASIIQKALRKMQSPNLSISSSLSLFHHNTKLEQNLLIHDFLQNLTESVHFRLLQKDDLQNFAILIKYYYQKEGKPAKAKIRFLFPRSLKNTTFQDLIKHYFNINDSQMTLQRYYPKSHDSGTQTISDQTTSCNNVQNLITEAISDETILPGEEFLLTTQEPITHITRQFQIDNEIKSIDIPLNSRVEDLHQLIQKAFNTGSSIKSISLSNEPLKNYQLISQLYIPPDQKFIVKLNVNPKTQYTIHKHDHLKIESVDVELDVDSQVSIIKQLCDLPKTTILYSNRKLNDTDTIKDVVQSNSDERVVIDAYISNLYYFEYGDSKRKLELTGPISNNLEAIKSRFQKRGLPQDKEIFLTDEKGISFIPNNKYIDEYPNGTTFKVKLVMKLQLNIKFGQDQYPIEIENTKSGQDLLHQLSTITSQEEEALRIYSPLLKVIEPDHFLFEYFTDPNKTYRITAIPLKEFPFINESGKLFYVYLSPYDRISYVKELIKKPKKKSVIKISPDDTLYLVYNGQLLDDAKLISSILEQSSDNLEEEEEDTAPLDFDEPINVYVNDISLINVTWTVVATSQSSSSNSSPTVNKIIKGTKISTIQNIISKASRLHYESIVLVSNGEELPSEFELDEDITLDVTIRQYESATPIDLAETMSQTQRILEKNATTAKSKVSDDDDGYEYEDENNDIDKDKLLEPAHGVITRSDNDEEYVYKFKYINGEEFELQLPKDVSVIQVIEAIVNMRNNEGNITQPEDVTISMGSTRLNDHHIFTSLTIPQTVNYFSVKVISIRQSLLMG